MSVAAAAPPAALAPLFVAGALARGKIILPVLHVHKVLSRLNRCRATALMVLAQHVPVGTMQTTVDLVHVFHA